MVTKPAIDWGPVPDEPITDADTAPIGVVCPMCHGARTQRVYPNDADTVPCDFCGGHGRLHLEDTQTNGQGTLRVYKAP